MKPNNRMRTPCLSAALIGALLIIAAAGVAAAAETSGAIRGRVVNGTTGNRPVGGVEVRLWRMPAEQANQLAAARTDPQGAFKFASLPPDGTYVITAEYRGVNYTSQPLRLNPGQTATVMVAIYEPGTNRPEIFFPYRLVLVERIGVGAIAIREVLEVTNPSRYTYLGDDEAGHRVTIRVSAPQGARDLAAIRGVAAPVITNGRLMDAAPLPPGSFQLAFGYVMRYWGAGVVLRWTMDERTGGMDVFIPDTGVRLHSAALEPRSPGTVQGQRILRYASDTLGKGQMVEVRFAGLPVYLGPLASWLAASLALALVASLAAAARRAARKKSLEALPDGASDPKPEPLR